MKLWQNIILILIVAAQGAQALTGGSELVLLTPWSFLQKQSAAWLSTNAITDSQTFPSLDWQLNPWIPHLTNVKWNLNAKMQLTNLTTTTAHLISKQLQFTLTIQGLTLNQTVVENIGGASVSVHVQASCGAITMTQTAAASDVVLAFAVQPQQIVTSVSSFKLQWPANSWQVSNFTCTGPVGFSQSVQQQIVLALQSAAAVQPWIQGLVAQKIQSQANTLMTQLAIPTPVQVSGNPLPLVLSFSKMENAPQGIMTFGTLVWSGKAGETNLTNLVLNGLPSAAESTTVPLLISPSAGWTNLTNAELQARGEYTRVNMNQVQSFHSLLNSPFEKFVEWPDLVFYSSSSPFYTFITTPTNLSMQWQSDGTALLAAPVNAIMTSQRNGQTWNYISIKGSATGKAAVTISGGKLNLAVTTTNSNLTPKFEPDYVGAFNANPYLAASVIQGLDEVVNQGYSYSSTLSTLNLGVAGTAKFNGWEGLSRQLIGMPLQFTPAR